MYIYIRMKDDWQMPLYLSLFLYFSLYVILFISNMKKGVLFWFSNKFVSVSISFNFTLTAEEWNQFFNDNTMMTYRASVFFPKLLFVRLEKAKDILHGATLYILLHCDSQIKSKKKYLFASVSQYYHTW